VRPSKGHPKREAGKFYKVESDRKVE